MSSRNKILEAVRNNQPNPEPLHQIPDFTLSGDLVDTFITTSELIGSRVQRISALSEIQSIIAAGYSETDRVLSLIPDLADFEVINAISEVVPHTFEDVKVAVIKGRFGVAENSAIWVTEELTGQRVIPFIAEHLVIVININDIVPTMHHAYQRIADQEYGYGAFIAGPSKTADIEQSLVRGAHGPRSLAVLLLDQ